MKNLQMQDIQKTGLIILFWTLIGSGLRFYNLAAKPPWTDEFATFVAQLGRSFQTVPINQIISLETLLSPLKILPLSSAENVSNYLIYEDVHPPIYFILAHLWAQLFPAGSEYISVWVARALPAIFGILSIPAMYIFGRLIFRSPIVAHIAAALMAVSPYGIFIAQEARHYTLSILWVISSLSCLLIALENLKNNQKISIKLSLIWILINTLGIATHFFFILTLIGEAIVIFICQFGSLIPYIKTWKISQQIPRSNRWNRLYLIALGTVAGAMIWLPMWLRIYSDDQTQWIHSDNPFNLLRLINPIVQSLAAWITMTSLLPVESPNLIIVIISGLMMLIFFLWFLPIIWRGLQIQLNNENQFFTSLLVLFSAGIFTEFFLISYLLGIDITRGARYNFVYFPAMILLLAGCLAPLWENQFNSPIKPPKKIAIILIMGLISSITVGSNLGYQKYYRPDLLIPIIQQNTSPNATSLIATNHQTLVQVGEIMGLGWQFKKSFPQQPPQFLLANEKTIPCQNCQSPKTLQKTITKLAKPIDLWLVNFPVPVDLKSQNCSPEKNNFPFINGYSYQLYRCR